MKYPDQRIGIFIDVQNMYHSAKALHGARVNFQEILKTAVAGRKLIRVVGYAIQAQLPEEEAFFEALRKAGIEVRLKELQTFFGGMKKGDWDVGIAVDVLKTAPKLDVVVLVSGDGDFQLLLHHVKAAGCRAEVISFRKSTSGKLVEEADDYIDLSKDYKRYTMSISKRKPQKR